MLLSIFVARKPSYAAWLDPEIGIERLLWECNSAIFGLAIVSNEVEQTLDIRNSKPVYRMSRNVTAKFLLRNQIVRLRPEEIVLACAGILIGLQADIFIGWISLNIPLFLAIKLVLLGTLAMHGLVAITLLRDLFRRSRRSNKSLWAFLIISLPFVSFFLYRATMQRYKPYGGYAHFGNFYR